MHDPFSTFQSRTVASKDAVASMSGFVGFLDPGPVGLLERER